MQFFTSPKDLKEWIKNQGSSDNATKKIIEIIGLDKELDVLDICKSIFEDEDADNSSEVLFELLSNFNVTSNMNKKSDSGGKMKKEAQSQRTGLYNNLPLRVCPKLPKRSNVISTWNCREHCLDGVTLDEDPNRVICLEAIWRRHIMDKFSRDFKDKDGKLVGGYINDRFQVYNDDGGNPMQLANDEKTRKPRPHQYSTERRLEEGRGEKTESLTASCKCDKITKIASDMPIEDDEVVYSVFNDVIEMREAGISDEDILFKVSEHYDISIPTVAMIDKFAENQLKRHNGQIYAYNKNGIVKTAALPPKGSTLISNRNVDVIPSGSNSKANLEAGTNVVLLSINNNPDFQIVDGPDAGKQFKLANINDIVSFDSVDGNKENIQMGADDVLLNEEIEAIDAKPANPAKPDLSSTPAINQNEVQEIQDENFEIN